MTRGHSGYKYREFARTIQEFQSDIKNSEDLETLARAMAKVSLIGSGAKLCGSLRKRRDICFYLSEALP